MLGCDGVKVYQFFYQSKEEYEMMMNHQPKLFILPPFQSSPNVTTFEYDFGKHIPLQLIFDVYDQSKYFRLRIGQIMKIIEFLLEILSNQIDNKMFNHDLDPKNIWIIFDKGQQLQPEFNDKISFQIQIQGRWQSKSVEQYNYIIFKIIKQLAQLMEKNIPNKNTSKEVLQNIQDLQNKICRLQNANTINQMYSELKKVQTQHQQKEDYKIDLDVFETGFNRSNRLSDAKKNIQLIYEGLKSLAKNADNKNFESKYLLQYQFYLTYQHLIDFTRHFHEQLHKLRYSDFKQSNKQNNIDFQSFNLKLQNTQKYHPYQLGKIELIHDSVILESFSIRGYINFFDKQTDPSYKINTLLGDALQYFLCEIQNIQRHLTKYYIFDKEQQDTINFNCKMLIGAELKMVLIWYNMELFQNYLGKADFQTKIFKQYSNVIEQKVLDLF